MKRKARISTIGIVAVLIISLLSLNVQSNFSNRANNEPELLDNLNGNWTAKWSLNNPDNYTLTNIELNDGKAKLKLNHISFKEDISKGFKNGTWDNLIVQGTTGIGLDLNRDTVILIADTNNNRVIKVEYDKWLWQYGSNTSFGFGLNQLYGPTFAFPLLNDRILITDSRNHRVIEVGSNYELYWQYGVNGTPGTGNNSLNTPSSAVPMANGNILIADTGNNIILEVNRNKQIVQEYDIGLESPSYAEELSNGSILITDKNNHRIIEVNKSKKIYWQYGGKKGVGINQLERPNFATRLKSGTTLISDTEKNHRVIEVNNTKDILWQYGVNKTFGYGPNQLNKPSCAIMMLNGNILITDSSNHRVLNVDHEKTWLWQYGTNNSVGSGVDYLNTPKSGLPILKKELTGHYTSAILDGGEVTNWTTINWNQTVPSNTEIRIYTRTGDTPNTQTGTWSVWSQRYQNPNGETISSPNNRYFQYKVVFITRDMNLTPVLKDIYIKGMRYEPIGELITETFEPDGLLSWNQFSWEIQLKGQNIQPYYSTSAGPPWNKVPSNGDLSNIAIDSGRIRFRFLFSTLDFSISPVMNEFSLIFERKGQLHKIFVTPNHVDVVAGEQLDFIASGTDAYGRELEIQPTWTSTVGSIINGTLSVQTKTGTGFVNATAQDVTGSASVNVIPAELDYIVVIPTEVTVIAGETQLFFAEGYDKFGNKVWINPTWETDIGVMENNLFMAQNFAGTGMVMAKINNITGIANVNVELNASTHHPPKILSRIPNQVKPEDSVPWILNLANYESDDEDTGEKLVWYMTNVDKNLYSVTGEFSKEDILTFIPVLNAYGNNKATLFLVDSDNMTASQTLWVNITPVNDRPVINKIPDIMVHYDEPYTFDYSNYVYDVETPDEKLILTVEEPSGQKYTTINGLNVTYNYPKNMLGKTVTLTIKVSDGKATVDDIFKISITDNHSPKLIKPFPEISLHEGQTLYFIFNLNDYFMDPDNDPLSYSASSQFINVELHNNNSITISSPITWSGIDTITFRAMDTVGAMVEGYAKVTVLEINDPPRIAAIPTIYVHYGDEYQFNISKYISDPDNETSELKFWTSNPEHIRFHSSQNTIMLINFPEAFLGNTIAVILYVSDGIDIVNSEFFVQITDNYPPILKKKLKDIYFKEDAGIKNAFNLLEYFSDRDDEKLNFYYELINNQNITIIVNSNNSVDIISKKDWFGTTEVIFRAVDDSSAFAEGNLKIVVIPVNDPPIIQPIPTQKGKTGERWIIDLRQYLNDVDNNLTELEIILNNDLVTVIGKQLMFYSDKPIKTKIEFIVNDGYQNSSGIIELIVTTPESDNLLIQMIWVLLLVIILIIIVGLIVVFRKRRGSFVITDIFIIHKTGLLIKFVGSTLNVDKDEDLISGMFTGIKSFMADIFTGISKEENDDWELNQLKMGKHELMIKQGKHIFIAVNYKGDPGKRLPNLLSNMVKKVENIYGHSLKDWDGTPKSVQGIESIIKPYLTEMSNRQKLKPKTIKPKNLKQIKKI